MNAFFNPQFTNCPRTLTCHSRANNKKKLNMLQKKMPDDYLQ